MKKSLFIIGYMGVGKSRIGQKISRILNLPFIDSDQIIEQQENRSISEIFKTNGESYFRKLETDFIKYFDFNTPCVVSCGGGLPCHANNLEIILENGNSLYLSMDFEKIIKKLKKNKTSRPMISSISEEKFYQKNKSLYLKRIQYYEQANFHLEANQMWKEQFLNEIYSKL